MARPSFGRVGKFASNTIFVRRRQPLLMLVQRVDYVLHFVSPDLQVGAHCVALVVAAPPRVSCLWFRRLPLDARLSIQRADLSRHGHILLSPPRNSFPYVSASFYLLDTSAIVHQDRKSVV